MDPFPLTSWARARARRAGGALVRRAGLVPGGDPDGRGEDGAHAATVLHQRVVAWFPEPPTNAYQLLQWAEPLRALDARHGLVVLTQDSRTTAVLRARLGLDPAQVACIARSATLDGLVARGRLALALYVSHHGRNLVALRYPDLVHAYLGHGDSDKAVSASNQLKAYDLAMVAGEAAVERVRRTVPLYDAGARLVQVGRPQLPQPPARPAWTPADGVPTVLYAPTWEGAQPSMAYSSVATHGEALVRSLLDSGVRVVLRPHPRTGANDAGTRAAAARLRALVAGPVGAATGSRVDAAADLAGAFGEADALVTDVSSLAIDWLPTGRPLVVTTPASPAAVVPPSRLLAAVPRVPVERAGDAGPLLLAHLADDAAAGARALLASHYLGDTRPGAATAAFLAACDDALRLRDAERARLAELAPVVELAGAAG